MTVALPALIGNPLARGCPVRKATSLASWARSTKRRRIQTDVQMLVIAVPIVSEQDQALVVTLSFGDRVGF